MKKQKFKLTLTEIDKLDDEINGVKDASGQVQVVGLIDDMINLKLKFYLGDINSIIAKYRNKTVEFRDKLIYKLGTRNENNIPEIKMYHIEKRDGADVQVTNPVYVQYETEYSKYLNKEVTFECYAIDLDLLGSVIRKESFPMLMKLVNLEEEPVSK